MSKRNENIKNNIKNLQKSIFELQPSLLFLSPPTVKGNKNKIKYNSFNKCKTKRCNSCCNRYDPKKISHDIKNISRTNRQKQKCYDIKTDLNNNINFHSKINLEDNNIKILINPIINKNKKDKNKTTQDRNKNKKENINLNKRNNSSYDNSIKSNIKDKNKKNKIGLKRNKSEFNIFNL